MAAPPVRPHREGATMEIRDRIQADVKTALKAKDKERLGTLRQVLAAIKQVEVDTRQELEASDVLAILDKMIKQRRESATQYTDAGRTDLADKENAEITVIEGYLPQPLTEEEIGAMIDAAIAEVGATSMKEMGKVMAILKPQISGRGDVGKVSAQVKGRITGG